MVDCWSHQAAAPDMLGRTIALQLSWCCSITQAHAEVLSAPLAQAEGSPAGAEALLVAGWGCIQEACTQRSMRRRGQCQDATGSKLQTTRQAKYTGSMMTFCLRLRCC